MFGPKLHSNEILQHGLRIFESGIKKQDTNVFIFITQSSNYGIYWETRPKHQKILTILHLWSKGTRPKLFLWPTEWSAWKTRRPLPDAPATKRCTWKIDKQARSEFARAKLGMKAASLLQGVFQRYLRGQIHSITFCFSRCSDILMVTKVIGTG